MSETTYYKRNRDEILNSTKDYYKNNKERLRDNARNKYRNLSEQENNIKRINIEETDTLICLKRRNKNYEKNLWWS